MLDFGPGAVFTACLMAAVLYFVWHTTFRSAWLEDRAQSQDLRTAATRLGFTLDRGQKRLKDDPAFPWETNQPKVLDLMRGTSATGTTYLLNVRYSVGSDPPETRTQTLVAFYVPDRAFPFFRLRSMGPPDLTEKLADTTRGLVDLADVSLFGSLLRKSGLTDPGGRIELTSARSPSRRYRFEAPNEDAVRALFGPAPFGRWDALAATEDWAADGCGPWLVIFQDCRVIPGDRLGDFFHQAESLAAAILESAPRSNPAA